MVYNLNGREFLEHCFATLGKSTFLDHQDVLVDDGSSDGSAAFVRNRFPFVDVIEAGGVGRAAAYERAIRERTEEIVAFLPSRSWVTAGWLEPLLSALAKGPSVGMAGALILGPNGQPVHAGGKIAVTGRARDHRVAAPAGAAVVIETEFASLSGLCARRQQIVDLGGLDPSYGSELEDVDLAWRARSLGLRVLHVRSSIVHVHTAETPDSPERESMIRRNGLANLIQNASILDALGGIAVSVARDSARIAWLAVTRQGDLARGVLRGNLNALHDIPALLARRSARARLVVARPRTAPVLASVKDELGSQLSQGFPRLPARRPKEIRLKPVKLGIVGCGTTTRIMYGPILRFLRNGVFVAACDPDEGQAKWAAEQYGAKQTFTDVDAFFRDADIDAVIVGSPVWAHCDTVVQASERGKHVLCEKPMARTPQECARMIEACDRRDVVLMVAFMKRFNKCFRRVTELINDGTLGDVFQVRALWSFFTPERAWRDALRTWGGVYQDHGSHTVDLCRWWLGDIETVSGEVDIIDSHQREVEDRVVATYRHRSGAVSIHQMTRVYHKPVIEAYEILGTKAALDVEFGPGWSFLSPEPFRMTLHRGGRTAEDITPYNLPCLDDEIRRHGQYLKELEHFCECVQTGARPLTSGADGRAAIEAVNAVYASSQRRAFVTLPLEEPIDLESLFRDLKERAINRPQRS